MCGWSSRRGSARERTRENSVPPAATLLLRTAKRRRALNGYRIVGSRGCHPLPLTRHPSFSLASSPVYLAGIPLSLSLSFCRSFFSLPLPRFASDYLFSSLLLWNHTFPLPSRSHRPLLRNVRTPAYVVVTTHYYALLYRRSRTYYNQWSIDDLSPRLTTPASDREISSGEFSAAARTPRRFMHAISLFLAPGNQHSSWIPNLDNTSCYLLFIIFRPPFFPRFADSLANRRIRTKRILDCTSSMISRTRVSLE